MFKFTKLGLTILAAATLAACHDDLDMSGIRGQLDKAPFDYSTVQNPTVSISYKNLGFGEGVTTSVYFELYAENPIVKNEHGDYVKNENLNPLFAGYTEQNGEWTGTVEFPAYATKMYAYSPGMLAVDLLEADIEGGTVSINDNGFYSTTTRTEPLLGPLTRAVAADLPDGPYGGGDYYTTAVCTYANRNNVSADANNPLVLGSDGKTTKGTSDYTYNRWSVKLGAYSNLAKDKLKGKTAAFPQEKYCGGIAYADVFYPEQYRNAAGEMVYDADILNISSTEAARLLGIHQQVIDVNNSCPNEYRSPSDLKIAFNSAVAITILGGKTGWSSSLGYYYYKDGETPTKPADINPILIIPNTMDGAKYQNGDQTFDFTNHIGVDRGSTIQLYYFGEDGNGEKSNIFPAGTRIGFIFKGHAWNELNNWSCGEAKTGNAGKSIDNQIHHFRTSTPGLDNHKIDGSKYSSGTGCAMYTTSDEDYLWFSFEDHKDDQNFSDVVFTLSTNPAGSFTDVYVVGDEETVTTINKGVYAFEDQWPSKGDYDLNDVVVEASASKTFKNQSVTVSEYNSKTGKYSSKTYEVNSLVKEEIILTPYENYAAYYNGLAVTLEPANSDLTMAQLKTAIKSAKLTINGAPVSADRWHYDENTVFITDIVNQYAYTTNPLAKNDALKDKLFTKPDQAMDIKLTLTYPTVTIDKKDPQKPADGTYVKSTGATKIKPFIYRLRSVTGGVPSTWEVHIPFEAPTSYMYTGYFGTEDDLSYDVDGKPTQVERNGEKVNGWYLRANAYPFAFFAAGSTINNFSALLDPNNETKEINTVYTKFKNWAESKGTTNLDWYK